MIEAIWTGRYPHLCSGEWKLIINGVDYTSAIPEEKRTQPMDTLGEYQRWHFDKDWSEDWEYYEDGLGFADWIKENPWVMNLPAKANRVYRAFMESDWRYESCGGCI